MVPQRPHKEVLPTENIEDKEERWVNWWRKVPEEMRENVIFSDSPRKDLIRLLGHDPLQSP